MAEPEELLSKADALMARHRQARTPADAPADIPVLTEVVKNFPSQEISGGPGLPESEWSAPSAPLDAQTLIETVRAALLDELSPEIDRLVEEKLKYTLEPLVEKIFNDLRDDLRTISREILTTAIKTAVEQELARNSRAKP